MRSCWEVLVVSVLVWTTACIQPGASTCSNGRVCPASYVCDDAHNGCASVDQIASCAGKAELAACTYAEVTDGACYDGVCLPAGCGNRAIESPEVCDDGNRMHGDGCSADCRSNETCGNGVIDDVAGEQCDDGNVVDGDGCQATCRSARCGDGVIDALFNEACDEGAANSNAPNATCRTNCQEMRCGDKVIDAGEICDDGNTAAGDGCSGDCQSKETCGNNYVDVAKGEQCDDGNMQNGDLCHANCMTPYCGDGIKDTALFEECDTGAANSNTVANACRTTCRNASCGDMVLDAGEVCDDGNHASGDTCSFDCKSNETCGNNYVDFVEGEQCDDANDLSHDGCSKCQPETPTWTTPSLGSPPARHRHVMVYDAARGRLLTFGGVTGANVNLGDTWERIGTMWSNVTPTSTSPVPRQLTAMAYDAERGRIVMFGGSAGGQLADTWEWNGNAWSNVTPATGSPPGRREHAMAYDARRKKVVLFAGTAFSTLADTWEWDGTSWTNVTPASGNPSARKLHAMVYDAARGKVVMFGGNDSNSVNLGDTWEWNGTTWTDVTPASGNPSARTSHSLAYDAARRKVVMYGGSAPGYLNDTWEWDGTAWTDVSPGTGNPGLRGYHAMAYDAVAQRVVLHAGLWFNNGGVVSDTWQWDGSTWTNVTPTVVSPPKRSMTAMAFDSSRGRAVVFGGYGTSNGIGDTWEWDGITWTNPTPAGPPSARFGPTAAFDHARERVIMFGGVGGGFLADTWSWDGSTWTNVTPGAGNPPSRYLTAMTYDAQLGRVVMFGGYGDSGFLNDMWSWSGTSWTNLTPASGNPLGRRGQAIAYDAKRKRVVLFGGLTLTPTKTYFADTWEWNGTSWTNVTPVGAGPVARWLHTLVYDAARGKVVLFGGEDTSMNSLGDTWEWDGTTWTLLNPPTSPAPRQQHAAIYDPVGQRMMVLGGLTSTPSSLAETLLYRYQNAAPAERCVYGLDGDDDGLIGCADPDCFGVCTPLCNPTIMTCTQTLPRCGDGVCQGVETKRLCADDCGAPPIVCGDFICDATETASSCPGDCP